MYLDIRLHDNKIYENTILVTCFVNPIKQMNFTLNAPPMGINSLVVEDTNTDTEGVMDQPDCVIIKYSFL